MLAMLKYDGTKTATLQYGDLVITVDSEPSKSEVTSRIPFVQAHSNDGAIKFAIHLEDDEDVGQEQPNAQVRLIKLDPSSTQPQVIFTYNWGGAHCCMITKIATVDEKGNWHIVDGGILDGDGYEFVDLDRNGGGELVSIDNSFLYAFCSYACSYAPTLVKKLTGRELRNVRTKGEYQEFLRYRLRQLETSAPSY
jgi:serine protease Do